MTLSESQLYTLIEKHCHSPRWATFPAVRNATGFARQVRTADAIAMALWPSMGLELHGFEIKSHRHDWLRELKKPDKADAIAKHCNRWWIVAGRRPRHRAHAAPVVGDGMVRGVRGVVVTRTYNARVMRDRARAEVWDALAAAGWVDSLDLMLGGGS